MLVANKKSRNNTGVCHAVKMYNYDCIIPGSDMSHILFLGLTASTVGITDET
jgi:hypothetical protein